MNLNTYSYENVKQLKRTLNDTPSNPKYKGKTKKYRSLKISNGCSLETP